MRILVVSFSSHGSHAAYVLMPAALTHWEWAFVGYRDAESPHKKTWLERPRWHDAWNRRGALVRHAGAIVEGRSNDSPEMIMWDTGRCLFYMILLLTSVQYASGRRRSSRVLRRFVAGAFLILHLPDPSASQFRGAQLAARSQPGNKLVGGIAVTVFCSVVVLAIARLSWHYFEGPLVKRGQAFHFSRIVLIGLMSCAE